MFVLEWDIRASETDNLSGYRTTAPVPISAGTCQRQSPKDYTKHDNCHEMRLDQVNAGAPANADCVNCTKCIASKIWIAIPPGLN